MASDQLLDPGICDSCKHLVTEKDKIIDDLKRNCLTKENRVQTLENDVMKLEEQIIQITAGIYF